MPGPTAWSPSLLGLSPPSRQDTPGTHMRTLESTGSRFAHTHRFLQPRPSGRGPGKQAGGHSGVPDTECGLEGESMDSEQAHLWP